MIKDVEHFLGGSKPFNVPQMKILEQVLFLISNYQHPPLSLFLHLYFFQAVFIYLSLIYHMRHILEKNFINKNSYDSKIVKMYAF